MLTVWTTILLGVAVVRIALARSGPSDGSDLASYVTVSDLAFRLPCGPVLETCDAPVWEKVVLTLFPTT